MTEVERTLLERRTVRPFVSYDEALDDRRERHDVVLFDLHGLWWSVPMELNIHEINGQIAAALELGKLARFPDEAVRVHRGDWPR